jgi:hypothetical protein
MSAPSLCAAAALMLASCGVIGDDGRTIDGRKVSASAAVADVGKLGIGTLPFRTYEHREAVSLRNEVGDFVDFPLVFDVYDDSVEFPSICVRADLSNGRSIVARSKSVAIGSPAEWVRDPHLPTARQFATIVVVSGVLPETTCRLRVEVERALNTIDLQGRVYRRPNERPPMAFPATWDRIEIAPNAAAKIGDSPDDLWIAYWVEDDLRVRKLTDGVGSRMNEGPFLIGPGSGPAVAAVARGGPATIAEMQWRPLRDGVIRPPPPSGGERWTDTTLRIAMDGPDGPRPLARRRLRVRSYTDGTFQFAQTDDDGLCRLRMPVAERAGGVLRDGGYRHDIELFALDDVGHFEVMRILNQSSLLPPPTGSRSAQPVIDVLIAPYE